MAIREATDQEKFTIAFYTSLMEEIKIRISTINTLATCKTGILDYIAQESCYLQLRFMCESVALCRLVAHGDIKETKTTKFRDEYHAGKILRQLDRLHKEYFPFHTTVTFKNGVASVFIHKEEEFLKKSELISLYERIGERLHRGALKRVLSREPPLKVDFPEVVAIAQKFENLLSTHVIARLSGNPAYQS